MAYTFGNKCAKNLCKRIVLLQLIIENVVTCFFGTQCNSSASCCLNHDVTNYRRIAIISSDSNYRLTKPRISAPHQYACKCR